MRKLALDLGKKSCGFAISDENAIISQPLENFHFLENDWNTLLDKIDNFLLKYKIDTFILGYPLKTTGVKSEMTFIVEKFKEVLEEEYQLPVILIDERESTKISNQMMIEAGLSAKKRKARKDKMAAQLILQKYLEWGK